MAFEMMPGADPCPNRANAPLTGNGALNCPGFPFDVTFPAGAKVKREDAGPMRTFMADLSPGAAAVGVLAWPSFVTPPTPLQIRDYLDKSLDGALKELRAETLGPIVDVPTFPGQPGRGVDFASKAVRGRMELHQVDGWIVRLVVGGPPTSPVALGTPSARSFLSSLRLRPRTAPRARMKRTGPVDIPIPEYAWESEGETPHRFVDPSVPLAVVVLPGGCTDQLPDNDGDLDRALRHVVPPEMRVAKISRATVRGAPVLRLEADMTSGGARLPVVGVLACGVPNHFVFLVASSDRAKAAAMADNIVLGIRPAAP
jgi:hypothetical protein